MVNLKMDKRWFYITPNMLQKLEAFRKMLVDSYDECDNNDKRDRQLSRKLRSTRKSLNDFLDDYTELDKFVEEEN